MAMQSADGVFVSWRLLSTEYNTGISFNVYRNDQKINAEPITTKTNFVDAAGKAGDVYVIESIQGGKSTMSQPFTALGQNYLAFRFKSLPTGPPMTGPAPSAATPSTTHRLPMWTGMENMKSWSSGIPATPWIPVRPV